LTKWPTTYFSSKWFSTKWVIPSDNFSCRKTAFLRQWQSTFQNFFFKFPGKNVFVKKFHPAFINLSNWPRKCFPMKECFHFRLSLFQESLTFWKKRKQKKKRQKQKQKNSFKYFYSFHCFAAAKPQTLTTYNSNYKVK